MKHWTRATIGLTLGATLLFGGCGSDDDSSSEPEILPAGEGVGDASPADLEAAWVRNLAEVPAADNMFYDASKCDMDRSTDDVYFAPTWAEPGDATASCTMSADQVMLLIPAAAFCFEATGDTPDTACLDGYYNLSTSSITIDDVVTDDLTDYQVDTEVETAALPDANSFEVPAGESDFISRGQVVLAKIPAGDHVVKIASEYSDGFAGSLTINLTVED